MRAQVSAPDVKQVVFRRADIFPAHALALSPQKLIRLALFRGRLQIKAAITLLSLAELFPADKLVALRRALGKPLLHAARIVRAALEVDVLRVVNVISVGLRRRGGKRLTRGILRRAVCRLLAIFVHSRPPPLFSLCKV